MRVKPTFLYALFNRYGGQTVVREFGSVVKHMTADTGLHRSIAGHNPYNLFILTIDYSNDFTTGQLLTIEHIAMFVVKSIVIQINDQVCGSISSTSRLTPTKMELCTGFAQDKCSSTLKTWFVMCGGRSSVLHFGPLIEANNLYAPVQKGNVRVRRKINAIPPHDRTKYAKPCLIVRRRQPLLYKGDILSKKHNTRDNYSPCVNKAPQV